MIENFCNYLIKKIRIENSEINDEQAEIIKYGLEILIGEIPKIFIILFIAYVLNVFYLTIFTVLIILPYRTFSGGLHLKTHLQCILGTSFFYSGNAFISNYILIENFYIKYLFYIFIFSIITIYFYAPADTSQVPILSIKKRNLYKLLSYISMSLTLFLGVLIKVNVLSNIILFSVFLQTLILNKFMYKLTGCQYGYINYYNKNN